ncbi:MAG: hypothetical protein Kow009_14750 [Spirochaetales bacterium]
MNPSPFKTILMHGFTREEALTVMRLVKEALNQPKQLIFALTTQQSLQKKLEDLILELEAEHRAMTGQDEKT